MKSNSRPSNANWNHCLEVMLRKFSREGGVELTDAGRRVALEFLKQVPRRAVNESKAWRDFGIRTEVESRVWKGELPKNVIEDVAKEHGISKSLAYEIAQLSPRRRRRSR
jgi:hypothetical protein